MVEQDQTISGSTYEGIRAALPIGDAPPPKRKVTPAAVRSVDKKADELAESMHTRFMKLVSDKVAEKGGHLTADDVEEMGEEFRRNMGDIKSVFMEAVESFTRAQEKSRDASERGNIFTRLMIHKFEHQFVEDRKLRQHPDRLTRRMLPGFMNALNTMVGTQKQAEFEKQAKAVANKARADGNGEIDWEDVYKTSAARMISLGAQIEMAQHFREPDKRIEWLMAMVNSNLIPAEIGVPGADWEFSREAAIRLLGDVFADLRTALREPRTRDKIRTKMGHDMIVLLDEVAMQFK